MRRHTAPCLVAFLILLPLTGCSGETPAPPPGKSIQDKAASADENERGNAADDAARKYGKEGHDATK